MIIRFVIDNVLSYGEQKEFNTIASKTLKTLPEHKYDHEGFKYLKLSSIYGANGSGKSNLIKSLDLLKGLVLHLYSSSTANSNRFKFREDKTQTMVIEFISDDTAFLYGVKLSGPNIATEELYLSGLGKMEDKLIFERNTDKKGLTTITFSSEYEKNEKSKVFKEVLMDFIKPHETILGLLSKRSNEYLADTQKAYRWFAHYLQIVTTSIQANALAHFVDTDKELYRYATDTMKSLNVGIASLAVEKVPVDDFFKGDRNQLEHVKKVLEDSPQTILHMGGLAIVKEPNGIYVKTLKIGHSNGRYEKMFDLHEESDGTRRLLDFMPIFNGLLSKKVVFVIDEIERSIHPLLIKELIRKFSEAKESMGQLIFSTHESNLLDLTIFRKDEIWFVEKDSSGNSDVYPLSDFKVHHTIDIQKGYMKGRFGSIPFLGNLRDLNW